ncbi:unnamed protein product [Caenorhabditis sp. 36 PRJEB53466]|nr:unnamed protein product [Caenorhabditis sp. 36 PRJEB53466]
MRCAKDRNEQRKEEKKDAEEVKIRKTTISRRKRHFKNEENSFLELPMVDWSTQEPLSSLEELLSDANMILIEQMDREQENEKGTEEETVDAKSCVEGLKKAMIRLNSPALSSARRQLDKVDLKAANKRIPIRKIQLAFSAALAILTPTF